MAGTKMNAAVKNVAAKPLAITKPSAPKAPAKKAPKATSSTKVSSASKKPVTPQKSPAPKKPATVRVSDEQRYRMIAEAAYYRAESSCFQSDPLRDWVEAENDIDALLNNLK